MLTNLLLVALGGAVGSSLRYLISLWFLTTTCQDSPWATLVVNVTGSFIIGVLAGIYIYDNPPQSPALRMLVATGFCGGFTTFSTFSLEGLRLIQSGALGQYTLYTVLTLALSLLATLSGYLLAQAIR